jgi:hypothetical protein
MGAGVWNQQGSLALCQAIDTAAGNLTVRLLGSSIVLSPLTTLAQLVSAECAFSGYTAQVIPTSTAGAFIDPQGGSSFPLPGTVTFRAAGNLATPGVVYGWWVQTAAGALMCAQVFTNPIDVTLPNQGLELSILMNLFNTDIVESNYP